MKALHFLPITLLSIISCMSIIACSNDDSNKKNDEVITITPLGNSQRYFDNGLTFTSQSGSENIEFTCNGDWNVSVANTLEERHGALLLLQMAKQEKVGLL